MATLNQVAVASLAGGAAWVAVETRQVSNAQINNDVLMVFILEAANQKSGLYNTVVFQAAT
ncbi:hypothetical protein [Pseudomonas sp. M5A4_2d]